MVPSSASAFLLQAVARARLLQAQCQFTGPAPTQNVTFVSVSMNWHFVFRFGPLDVAHGLSWVDRIRALLPIPDPDKTQTPSSSSSPKIYFHPFCDAIKAEAQLLSKNVESGMSRLNPLFCPLFCHFSHGGLPGGGAPRLTLVGSMDEHHTNFVTFDFLGFGHLDLLSTSPRNGVSSLLLLHDPVFFCDFANWGCF